MTFSRRARVSGRRNAVESTAPDPNAVFMGQSVRELRAAKEMTLQELSIGTKLSVGYLSQVERGLSAPSISALQAIAKALDVTVSWFFRASEDGEGSESAYIVRGPERRKLRFESGITDELLSPNLAGALELLVSRFPPGSASGTQPYTHRGEEGGLVVEGMLELWIENEKFLLKAGDSFSFPSTKPHRYRNPSKRETVVLWVITPPTY
jgi:transcriptional regulator with XRE-family HTH domain